ncbi:MAG: PAS domain S-box-containing protein [Cyclobacteriaceae bacterium]|jgi:PAS domain S-box-containing protein
MAKSIIEKKTLDHQLGDELISINAVEKEFDDIASLAAIICQMPISLITLVHNDNIYFKSRFGLNAEKFSTEYSFCKQALANPHEILVVEDARLDKRFKNNPFTIGEPHVVFYAGIPMILPSGAIIGVLSVLDHIPRILTNDQIKALKIFSNQIEKLFELSQSQNELEEIKLRFIKESERLSNIIRATHVGTWEWNVQTGKMDYNERWAEMIGYTLKELSPLNVNTWQNFIYPEDLEFLKQKIDDCLTKKSEYYDIEYRIRHKDSSIVWVNHFGRVIEWTAEGKPLSMLGAHTDITAKVMDRERVKKSEARFRVLVENGADAIAIIGTDGFANYVSPSITRVLGYTEEEALKLNLFEIIHPDDLAGVSAKIEEVLNNPGIPIYGHTSRTKHKDGSWRYLEATITNLLDDPSISGIVDNFRDVTQRKEKDIEIQKAKERFERVTQATADAIWDWDIESETFFRSSGYKELLGYNFKKLSNQREFWNECFHCDDLAMIKNRVTEALGNPKTSKWRQEYRVIHKDGTIKTVSDRAVIIRDQNGKAIRMVGAVTDISYRKEHEKELLSLNESLKEYTHNLEISNEQLEQFAFIASHDLQEPLRMITSFLSQLERKFNDKLDHKAREYIQFATDGAKRMRQIVLNLLEYSIAGNLNESIELVDMGELLADYTLLRRKLIKEKSAKIITTNLPMVSAFKVPLIQTVHCLLDNAIKYARNGVLPKIEFIIVERKEDWLFSIKDNGIGISMEFYEKIFIMFQRLHNRDEYEGTGIGLSIAKKNVESWGGKIWLESLKDEGTTFYFTLSKGPLDQKKDL